MAEPTHDEHYVPQMYLKRFAEGKTCQVLDKYWNIKPKSVKGICYEDNLYEFTSEQGEIVYQNLYEKELFHKLETDYKGYFDELIEVLDNKADFNAYMDENNTKLLMIWMSSMLLRNVAVMGMTKEIGAEIGIEWTDAQSRNNAILHNTALIEHNAEKLYKTHKVIVFKNNSDISFVTSSFPVLIIPSANKLQIWVMPLTDKYIILLTDKGNKDMTANSVIPVKLPVVDFYNKLMVRNELSRYTISKDRKSLERYKHLCKG